MKNVKMTFILTVALLMTLSPLAFAKNSKELARSTASSEFDQALWQSDLEVLRFGFTKFDSENRPTDKLYMALLRQFSKLHKAIDNSHKETVKIELLKLGLESYLKFRTEDFTDDLLSDFAQIQTSQPSLFSKAVKQLKSNDQSELEIELLGFRKSEKGQD